MRRLVPLVAATVLVGCGGNGDDPAEVEDGLSPLADAAACHLDLAVTDDGTSLIVNTVGEESAGVSFRALDCVHEALETPESVKAHIGRTRSLDGTQEASWGSLEASWTYHPDNGLNLIVEMVDEGVS